MPVMLLNDEGIRASDVAKMMRVYVPVMLPNDEGIRASDVAK